VTRDALLIHGLSSSPEGWWRVRGWLADGGWETRTVALLGHGGRGPAASYSLEAYAADVLAAEPGPHDLVVAHSLGGSIATVLAAADPAWTARLVLLDPVWFISPDRLQRTAAEQVAEIGYTAESLDAAKPFWDPRDRAGKLAAIAAVEPDAVARTFGDVTTWDLRQVARDISVPTLVLGGDPDVYTMLEPADAFEVSEDAAAMRYVVVPGAGHSPHRDAPDATRTALADWLETSTWNAG
jgi:pimeloyl-ACP methyl ester carboxylesterase